MALEKTLEDWGYGRLLEVGANPIKYGQEGLPDRMVLWGRGLHFWVEWKKFKTGRLRASQKVWKKYLTSIGDIVYVIDTREQLEEVICTWRFIYGPASAHRV